MFSESSGHVHGHEQAATECNASTFTSVQLLSEFWITCILHISTFYSIIYLISLVNLQSTSEPKWHIFRFIHQSDTFTRVLLVWGTFTWQKQNQSPGGTPGSPDPTAGRSQISPRIQTVVVLFSSVHPARLHCGSHIQVFYVLYVLLMVILTRWHLFFLSVQQVVLVPLRSTSVCETCFKHLVPYFVFYFIYNKVPAAVNSQTLLLDVFWTQTESAASSRWFKHRKQDRKTLNSFLSPQQ